MGNKKLQPNTGLRFARYGRCSTDEQAKGEFSTIEGQAEATLRYVNGLGGIDAGFYADDGYSGTTLDRPALKRLLTDARAGKINVVVCTFLERLGRGPESSVVEHQLKALGVRIVYIKETFGDGDKTNMGDYLQKEGKRFVSGMYSAFVLQQTISHMSELFNHGYFVGGGIGFGYKTIPSSEPTSADDKPPRKRVPDEVSAPIVRQAFNVAMDSGSIPIARSFLETVTGRAWSYKQTEYLLTNRLYMGEARWRDLVKPAAHEPIVEEGIFNAVQQAIAAPATGRRTRTVAQAAENPHRYLLRGRVFCGCCTQPDGTRYRMTTRDATGRTQPHPYYECFRATSYREGTCTVKRVNAETLHHSLLTEMARMVEHPWRIRTHIERAAALMPSADGLEERVRIARRALSEIDRKLDKLADAIAVGGPSVMRVIAVKIGALEEERNAAMQEVARLESEKAKRSAWRPDVEILSETLSLLGQMWPQRNDEERTLILTRVVDHVVIHSRTTAEATLLPVFSQGLRMIPREIGSYGGLGEDNGARTHGLQSHNLTL